MSSISIIGAGTQPASWAPAAHRMEGAALLMVAPALGCGRTS
jgi:hypothetical protein